MVRGKGRFGLRAQGVQKGQQQHTWHTWMALQITQPINLATLDTHLLDTKHNTVLSVLKAWVTDCLVTHEPAYLVPVVVVVSRVARAAEESVTYLKEDSDVPFNFQSERKLIAEQFITKLGWLFFRETNKGVRWP